MSKHSTSIGIFSAVAIAAAFASCSSSKSASVDNTAPVEATTDQAETKPPSNDGPPSPDQFTPALEAAPTADGGALSPTFSWNVPCSVPARQFVERNGLKAEFTFNFVLEKHDAGFKFLIDKVALTRADKAIAANRQQVTQMTAGLVMGGVVNKNGEFVSALDPDKLVERVLETIGESADSPAGKMMSSPQMRAALAQAGQKEWSTWVETWLEADMAPGKPLSGTVEQETPLGKLPTEVTVENRGAVKGHPKLVLLASKQVTAGPKIEAAMKKWLESMAQQAGRNDPIPPEAYKGLRIERTVVAAIDPNGTKPHRVRFEETTSNANMKRGTVRDTMFDWSRAKGCGAAAP